MIPVQLQIEERTIQNRKAICVENKLEMLQQNLSLPFQNKILSILMANKIWKHVHIQLKKGLHPIWIIGNRLPFALFAGINLFALSTENVEITQ